MYKEVERFDARSDQGEIFEVVKFQWFPDLDPLLDGSTPEIRGKPIARLELSDGSPLREIDPETFEIVQTGKIIRKVT